ncbi:hypothetical protein ACFL59_02800 [Planctomycetota bacterium]
MVIQRAETSALGGHTSRETLVPTGNDGCHGAVDTGLQARLSPSLMMRLLEEQLDNVLSDLLDREGIIRIPDFLYEEGAIPGFME